MKILITGAAGYIGQLLIKRITNNDAIEEILALDKKQKPTAMNEDKKISYLRLNLAKDNWEDKISETPDAVVHLAFDIRTKYGQIKKQEFNNISGTERVLKYCLEKKIKKFIYFSSVAAYGAKPANIGKLLTEDDPLTETVYPYASQKRITEEILSGRKKLDTQILILRSGSINGPEGEKRKKIGLLKFIKNISPILPITNPAWTRQYLHEEDAVGAINFFIFYEIEKPFEIFNLTPPDIMTMKDMAKLLHKKTVKIPASLIKPIFRMAWHLSLGLVPAPPGSEKSFIYPINVDGSKINKLGFSYKYKTQEAFLGHGN